MGRQVHQQQVQLFGHQLGGPLRGGVLGADPQRLGGMLDRSGSPNQGHGDPWFHFRFRPPWTKISPRFLQELLRMWSGRDGDVRGGFDQFLELSAGHHVKG